MKIIDLIKKKFSKPMIPTEWFLSSKDFEKYGWQNDFIDSKNKTCADKSCSIFGGNAIEILKSKSNIYKMLEFDDRFLYCVGINDHRADAANRAIASIFGVVLDKRETKNYRFEDFKAEIDKKNANIIQKYPTVYDLACQFPIKFSSHIRPATYDKSIPNSRTPLFKKGYYTDAPGWNEIR